MIPTSSTPRNPMMIKIQMTSPAQHLINSKKNIDKIIEAAAAIRSTYQPLFKSEAHDSKALELKKSEILPVSGTQ